MPIDEDTAAWARAQIESQFGFIDQLFEDLKQLRQDGGTDPGEYANARAAGDASAHDGYFVEAQMRGSKNIVLTWRLGQTEKHCKTCAGLDGQSHNIIGQQFRAFEQAAPRQVPFVNMLSTTGEFLRAYMTEARPPLLSFDYYQWWWGSDRYFEKLEQFREAAVRAGVPLAACFEVSANPGVEWGDLTRLPDNDRRLRQSVYTSLAYGVTGIEWFHSDMVFSPGIGALTPAGRDVSAINDEVAALGRVLAGLRSVDVFQTAPLPAGTRSLPKSTGSRPFPRNARRVWCWACSVMRMAATMPW